MLASVHPDTHIHTFCHKCTLIARLLAFLSSQPITPTFPSKQAYMLEGATSLAAADLANAATHLSMAMDVVRGLLSLIWSEL
jgi:hypothetical protein